MYITIYNYIITHYTNIYLKTLLLPINNFIIHHIIKLLFNQILFIHIPYLIFILNNINYLKIK